MSNMPSLSRGGESRGQGLGRGRMDEVDGSFAHLSTPSFCYAAAHLLPARKTSLAWKSQRVTQSESSCSQLLWHQQKAGSAGAGSPI